MSKDDVTQLVNRDALTRSSSRGADSIPPTWAVPAEAAAGGPPQESGGKAGMIAVVAVVAVVAGLGGFWYFNQDAAGVDANEPAGGTVAANAANDVPANPANGPKGANEALAAPKAPNIAMAAEPKLPKEALVAAALTEADETDAEALDTEPSAAEIAEEEAAAQRDENAEKRAKKVAKYNRRGELAIKMAKYKTAEILLKKAIQLDATFAPAHRNLGVARARRGNVKGARAAYEEYIRLAPTAPDAPDVRRILGL